MKQIACLLIHFLVGALLFSCSDSEESAGVDFTPKTFDVKGKVEKGPFISGSAISIQPMDARMQVLGNMFTVIITDDVGNFTLGSKEFSTPYAEFMANGYFFNEVKGELSNGTLTLRALVDLEDSETINVNVLTHLKYSRIKNLIAAGKPFSQANRQAQEELMLAFGLKAYADKDVSSFSITAGSDESAALLAISSLLIAERSEAALTEYLSKLSADFGEDGTFSEENKKTLADDKSKLARQLSEIKENVIQRYAELGLNVEVKDLVGFFDWNDDGIAGNELLKDDEEVRLDKTTLEIPNEGGEFVVHIDAPIPVYLAAQVEEDDIPSVSVPDDSYYEENSLYEGYDASHFTDKEIVCEKKLEGSTLTLTIAALPSKTDKTQRIALYDYVGNEVASVDLIQKGRPINTPSVDLPRLSKEGEMVIASVAKSIATGLVKYNVIEQLYASNKVHGNLRNYMNPNSDWLSNAWDNLYKANRLNLSLADYDKARLDVYEDYFNVLRALYFSNLIYGWGDVPYFEDLSQLELTEGKGAPREAENYIFGLLTEKLKVAIGNLEEKKNESLKDINGFFFVSKDVARVLLANIYLYEENYAAAKTLLLEVVEKGFYQLDATPINDWATAKKSAEVIYAFYGESETSSGATIQEPSVVPYITLTDVMLSLAECYCQLGESSVSEQYVQKVAETKGLNLTETEMLMKIKEIREQVLLHSGTYFAFLKRAGLAKSACGIEDYQLLFPIPNSELHFNPMMTQNPGY